MKYRGTYTYDLQRCLSEGLPLKYYTLTGFTETVIYLRDDKLNTIRIPRSEEKKLKLVEVKKHKLEKIKSPLKRPDYVARDVVPINVYKDGEFLQRCSGKRAAAKFTETSEHLLSGALNKDIFVINGYTLEYAKRDVYVAYKEGVEVFRSYKKKGIMNALHCSSNTILKMIRTGATYKGLTIRTEREV
ncbi:hypothetical protein N9924_00930 [bacterium]|nr:hypothetical protein [bacterium]